MTVRPAKYRRTAGRGSTARAPAADATGPVSPRSQREIGPAHRPRRRVQIEPPLPVDLPAVTGEGPFRRREDAPADLVVVEVREHALQPGQGSRDVRRGQRGSYRQFPESALQLGRHHDNRRGDAPVGGGAAVLRVGGGAVAVEAGHREPPRLKTREIMRQGRLNGGVG